MAAGDTVKILVADAGGGGGDVGREGGVGGRGEEQQPQHG